MLPNPRGGNGLGYDGDHPQDYEGRYLMKSDGGDADWQRLIQTFKTLNETPAHELEETLNPVFNIDRALWFLALENVFIDNDGYWTRASDFAMYTDPRGRLHMIPHDSNETFQRQSRSDDSRFSGVDLDPLYGEDDPEKPLIHRLLQVPRLRARYIAHVRTIRDEWLSWERIGPIAKTYQALIDGIIKIDTRKHSSYASFQKSLSEDTESSSSRGRSTRIGIRRFVENRREYLNQHPALAKPAPQFSAVTSPGHHQNTVTPGRPIPIRASFKPPILPDSVSLFFSKKKHTAFKELPMKKNDATNFVGSIPPQSAGEKIFFYVAARIEKENTVTFEPSSAEFNPMSIRIEPELATFSNILINEVMASNTKTILDHDNEYDDWIELRNVQSEPINLTGYYLSDNPKNPKKWQFPEGSIIQGEGLLIVWADEDHKSARDGIHTNFKLSKKGETISLYDKDERHNQRLDQVTFENLPNDQSWGRPQDNPKQQIVLPPSPGKTNP